MDDDNLIINIGVSLNEFKKGLEGAEELFKKFAKVNRKLKLGLDEDELKKAQTRYTKSIAEAEKQDEKRRVGILKRWENKTIEFEKRRNAKILEIQKVAIQREVEQSQKRFDTLKSSADADIDSINAYNARKIAVLKRWELKTLDFARRREYIKYTESSENKILDILNRGNSQAVAVHNRALKAKENAERKSTQTIEQIAKKQSEYILNLEAKLATEQRKIHQQALADQLKLMKSRTAANRDELNTMLRESRMIQANAVNNQNTMARSAAGVMSSETGTTLGHKFLTTAEYAAAGAAIYGISTVFRSLTTSIVEADSAVTKFHAILFSGQGTYDQARQKAIDLEKSVINLGIRFGGNVTELNEAALALGRAGESGSNLASSLEVVSKMAAVSGSSLDDVTQMLVTWNTVYAEESMQSLADKITAAANASLASVDGFKTMTSYVLSSGESIGMTSDSLIAFLASMKQIGKADSIVGTETRRLMNQLSSGSDDVRKAYWKMGIDVNKVYEGLAQGGVVAEQTFKSFMTTLSGVSKETAKDATKDLKEVLDKQTVISAAQASKVFDIQDKAVKDGAGSLNKAAEIAAQSYEKIWERAKNAMISGSVSFEQSFKEALTGGESNIENINNGISKFSHDINTLSIRIGEALGTIGNALLPVISNLDKIIISFGVYKAVLFAMNSPLLVNIATITTQGATVLATGGAFGRAAVMTAGYTTATNLATGAVTRLTGAMARNPLFIPAMVAGAIGFTVWDAHAERVEKLRLKQEKLNDELKKSAEFLKTITPESAFAKTKSDLSAIKSRIKELEGTIKSNKSTLSNYGFINAPLEEELAKLKRDKDALDRAVKIWEVDIAKNTKGKAPNINAVGRFTENDAKSEAERKAEDARKLAQSKAELKILQDYADKYKAVTIQELEATGKLTANDKRKIEALEKSIKTKESDLEITKKMSGFADKEYKQTIENIALVNEKQKLAETLNDTYGRINKKDDKADDKADDLKIKNVYELHKLENESKQLVANRYLDETAKAIELGRLKYELALAEIQMNKALKKITAAEAEEQIKAIQRIRNEVIKGIDEDLKLEVKIEFKGFDAITNSIASTVNGLQDLSRASNEWKTSNEQIGKTYDTNNKVMVESDEILGRVNATQQEKSEAAEKWATAALENSALEKKYAKNQKAYATQQLGMYGDMAGALGSFYKEGSTQAKNFQKVQQAMYMSQMAMQMSALLTQTATSGASIALMGAETTAAGTLAVAKQAGAGDPYTAFARVAAMAALLASFGIIVGGALSGGDKVSTSYDTLSAMTANTGTGTVLGDAEAGSDSIANSLEILSDYAKPEHNLLSQMNKSLMSIDNKISGVTTMLLRNAGFALGEGYTGFNTGFKNNYSVSQNATSIATLGGGVYAVGAMPLAAGMVADKLLLDGAIMGGVTSLTNKVLGGVFGKTSTSQELTDSGLIFGEQLITKAKEDFEGSAYQTIATTTKKKSWFKSSSSTSYKTYTQDMDEEIRNQFELILSNMYDSVISSADMLEVDKDLMIEDLDDFVVNLGKISLKGKTGEEMQELLSNVFGKTMDEMVVDAYNGTLDGFIKVGETISTTLARVSAGMEEAEYFIARLGYQFEDINYQDIINQQGEVGVEALKQSILNYEEAYYQSATGIDEIVQVLTGTTEDIYNAYTSLQNLRLQIGYTGQSINGLTMSMVSGAGGIENLSDGVSSYFENFYTEAQQSRLLTRQVSEEFKKLNLTMPETKDGFRLMVDSIDLSTSSGQELYGSLITLSDGFAEAMDSADSLIEKEKELTNERIIAFSKSFDPFLNALKSIKDMAESTSDSLGEQDIRAFWELDAEYQKLMSENKFEEAQAVFSKISSLSGTLTSENEGLEAGIASYMEDITRGATSKETEINKSIMGGIGSLYNLTTEQLKVLQSVGADGSITNAELESLTFATDDLKTTLIDAGFIETNTILGSIDEYSRLQLAELQNANAMETASLSTDTFKYLDYLGKKEQFDIASSLGKPFAEIEDFILQLQSFDIKDPIQDLEHMKSLIGYSFNTETGLVSYDQSKVTDLSKLWDVLPQDVKDAYGTLSGLATSQQSEFLAGQQNTLNTTLAGNISKEQKDVIDTLARVKSNASSVASRLTFNYDTIKSYGLNPEDYYIYSKIDNPYMSSVRVNTSKLEADLNNVFAQRLGLSTQQQELTTAQAIYDGLLKQITEYQQTQLPSFDVGSGYIPHDMTANIHQGEMIIPKDFASSIRQGQISIGGNGYNMNTETIEKALFLMNDKLGKVIAIQNNQLNVNRAILSEVSK